ncbi:hypothetical protein [Pseudokineococcus basanitobsidens]|uniref:hypothetical protein n=1 Tax=Pseudokineococcus basanitobsidens TaxID=1926649 RepID=UPI003BB74833
MSPQQASGPGAPGAPEDDLVCSARDCRAAAAWGLRWNNPRLHAPERRKTWLACDEHRERLATHLDVRGFLRDVVPVGALDGGRS